MTHRYVHAAIWELTWLSGACFILLCFFLPETSSSNILYRRSRRLRKLTGNSNLKSEGELLSENMTGKDILMIAVVRPFTLSFTEPMVFLLNLYIALIYGVLYIWFESFPLVFTGIYGFNLGEEGLGRSLTPKSVSKCADMLSQHSSASSWALSLRFHHFSGICISTQSRSSMKMAN